MICSLLSVKGNFLSRAFGQVPPHNFSDSQRDLQAPGPSGAYLATYSAPPCLLPCRHILHSFIAFNLSLSPEYRSLSAFSCTFRPSSGTLHWLSSGESPSHYTPVLVATPRVCPCESADGPYHALLSFVYRSAAGGVAKLWGQIDSVSKLTIYLPCGSEQDI